MTTPVSSGTPTYAASAARAEASQSFDDDTTVAGASTGDKSAHAIYRHRSPSNLQTGSSSVVGNVSASTSANPALQSPAFQSLLEITKRVVAQFKDQPKPDSKAVKKCAYKNYAYYPHFLEEASELYYQRPPEKSEESLLHLFDLATRHSESILIEMQSRNNDLLREFPLREFLEDPSKFPDVNEEILFVDNYLILHPNSKNCPLTGDDGIEGKLSFNVNENYAAIFVEVLIDLCMNQVEGISQAKFNGPGYHGIRSETGMIYLPDSDAERVSRVSGIVHQKMLEKLGLEVPPDDLYIPTAPGSQEDPIGFGYTEKSLGAERGISTAQERAGAITLTAMDCLEADQEEPEPSLLLSYLDKAGFSIFNSAFAARPGDTLDSIRHKEKVLRSWTQQFQWPSANARLGAAHSQTN